MLTPVLMSKVLDMLFERERENSYLLFISLSFYFLCLSIYLFIYLSIYLFIYLSIYLFTYLSIYLFTYFLLYNFTA